MHIETVRLVISGDNFDSELLAQCARFGPTEEWRQMREHLKARKDLATQAWYYECPVSNPLCMDDAVVEFLARIRQSRERILEFVHQCRLSIAISCKVRIEENYPAGLFLLPGTIRELAEWEAEFAVHPVSVLLNSQ